MNLYKPSGEWSDELLFAAAGLKVAVNQHPEVLKLAETPYPAGGEICLKEKKKMADLAGRKEADAKACALLSQLASVKAASDAQEKEIARLQGELENAREVQAFLDSRAQALDAVLIDGKWYVKE